VFVALGILAEIAFRRIYSPDTPSPLHSDRIFNCRCIALIIIFQGSIELIFFLPALWLASDIVALSHGPFLAPRPGIPFALFVALLSSLIGDFIYYWTHRLQHSCRWLWPIHELHHDDEHMNVTTALRIHWLESCLERAAWLIPAAFLPNPLITIPLLYLLGYARTTFEHLAVPIHLGPFSRVITSPANHRIHHSKLPEHIDKNFAAVWPIWDVIFGTYCAPKRGEYPPTGLISGKTSKRLRDAMWNPFEVAKKPAE